MRGAIRQPLDSAPAPSSNGLSRPKPLLFPHYFWRRGRPSTLERGVLIFFFFLRWEMDPWWTVGGGSRPGSKAPGSSRIPCRNFARGACRWGQNCRFSHDRKATQICKYFQNGFCGYGDRCSYQHILEAPALSRCGSESDRPALLGSMLLLNRRGSEPAISPEASVRSWGGARRDSEPAFSGMAQLQTNFGSMSMSLDEGDEDAEKTTSSLHPPNWALSKEFVPRKATSDSRSHEEKTDATPLMSESAPIKEAAPASLVSEEPKAAGGSGAAVAAAGATAAVAQSEDVVCGICMDKISQKALPEERLFGILPNCTHAYCVGCIRKWRKSRDFHSTVIKGCPECRVTSTYFIPNKYWVFESEEKEKLIETFKARTRQTSDVLDSSAPSQQQEKMKVLVPLRKGLGKKFSRENRLDLRMQDEKSQRMGFPQRIRAK
uniref:RING-type E3 ubiquitin transferase n=1 Tax=Anolis carolinensis TaxID=28377 RepID=A0A803TDE3_ANOCA